MLKNNRQFCLAASIAGIMGVTASTTTLAASIEEIVVTAQKREQSSQDVPIAISAFSGDDLRSLGAGNLQELTENVAGAELYDARGAGMPTWVIRGVGLSDYNANNTPTAAIYYDDFYLTSNVMGGIGLFDVGQVEVLKGPQGGLYGRNTTGGAVRVNSKKPSLEAHTGYISASYGRWGQTTVEGAYGGPITDKVAFRLSGKADQGGGWQDSLATPGDDEHGDRDFFAIKGQLLIEPSDELDILLKVEGGENRSESALLLAVGSHNPSFPVFCDAALAGSSDNTSCITNAGATALAVGAPTIGSIDPSVQDEDGTKTLSNPINELDNSWTNITAQVNWDLDFATLTSISSYIDFDNVQDYDYDGTGSVMLHEFSDAEITAWSQEFRLTSNTDSDLTWIVAAMYSEDQIDDFRLTRHDDNAFFPIVEARRGYSQETESWALYGVAEYQLNDQWRLNGSLRYTDEERRYEDGFLELSVFGFFLTQGLNETLELDDHWSGHIGLDWTPTENALIYAKLTRGFKSGGVFGGFPTEPDTVNAADEETVWAYELGFKSEWLDNSLRLNGALYYYDYADVQGYAQVLSSLTNTPLLKYTNVGDAEHTGAELEMLWLPNIEGLSLSGSISWLDAEIADSDAVTQSFEGLSVPFEGLDRIFSARLSYSFQAKYERSVFNDLIGSVQLNYSYRDDLQPTSSLAGNVAQGLSEVDGYDLVNMRLALEPGDGQWSIALSGRNLANEEYATVAGEDGFLDFSKTPGKPLTWAITFTYNWL